MEIIELFRTIINSHASLRLPRTYFPILVYFQFTMLQHYSQSNAMALCVDGDKTDGVLDSFAPEDLESVRRLVSFRSYVENEPDPQLRIDLLENDEYLTSVLRNELRDFHSYLHCFHGLLRCLALLVTDLPRGPLGKQVRVQ